ncbi:MAG TPA: DinB family protein [Gemmatimonadales bacterium]|nr:DinB family protein [Gemmatimonadales bacterium]
MATATSVSAQATGAAAPKGVRADMLMQLDDAASKLEQLAGAIPEDKLSWRPATGVRSVGEVVMHVAGGNYFLPTFAGVKAPADAPQGENAASRAAAIAAMQRSFDHVRAAIRALSDADLDKPTTMFGQQTTYRNVYLTTVTHAHEHLGQLIAYARSNGITPPWSRGAGGE